MRDMSERCRSRSTSTATCFAFPHFLPRQPTAAVVHRRGRGDGAQPDRVEHDPGLDVHLRRRVLTDEKRQTLAVVKVPRLRSRDERNRCLLAIDSHRREPGDRLQLRVAREHSRATHERDQRAAVVLGVRGVRE